MHKCNDCKGPYALVLESRTNDQGLVQIKLCVPCYEKRVKETNPVFVVQTSTRAS